MANDQKQVVISEAAYVSLHNLLAHFAMRADVGELTRDALATFTKAMLEANPHLRESSQHHSTGE